MCSSTASAAENARRLTLTPASRSCPRSQEAEEMTELLVSTKKGLFALSGEPGGDWEIVARAFAGEPVDYAVRDPRTRRVLATMTSPFYGPKVFYTERSASDWGAGTRHEAWEQADGVALPAAGELALERIWV